MNLIQELIAQGHAYYDEYGDLIGIASDGTHVSLGCNKNSNSATINSTIAYLKEFPAPEHW